jgi:hypothetical protein
VKAVEQLLKVIVTERMQQPAIRREGDLKFMSVLLFSDQ